MKIAYYCQHVLGIGHFHRSLEICRALAKRHTVTLILGGPKVEVHGPEITLFHLPGLHMNAEFKHLEPCDTTRTLGEVKAERQHLLHDFFQRWQPDVFLTELYPFGRKAFRFELDPVLTDLQNNNLPPCRCYASVRDILVERIDDRQKFEQRAVTTLNSLFDGLLIHSDPAIIPLDRTFGRMADIQVPVAYTGFVSRQLSSGDKRLRNNLRLAPDTKLIVASIGGGNVGGELLLAALQACATLPLGHNHHLQIFTGPYCDRQVVDALQRKQSAQVSIEQFAENFPDWLQAADLSISMAGYNTCMNILQAGVPALVYPFGQNREQLLRAKQLQKKAAMEILAPIDLQPVRLAEKIAAMLDVPRSANRINLNGAAESVQIIESWQQSMR